MESMNNVYVRVEYRGILVLKTSEWQDLFDLVMRDEELNVVNVGINGDLFDSVDVGFDVVDEDNIGEFIELLEDLEYADISEDVMRALIYTMGYDLRECLDNADDHTIISDRDVVDWFEHIAVDKFGATAVYSNYFDLEEYARDMVEQDYTLCEDVGLWVYDY